MNNQVPDAILLLMYLHTGHRKQRIRKALHRDCVLQLLITVAVNSTDWLVDAAVPSCAVPSCASCVEHLVVLHPS